MKCIILCAGYGTRLYPLTLNKPKALLEVGGKPIINYIIRKIEELEEVDEVFIVTNAKFYENFEEWLKNFKSKKIIKIINDQTTSNEGRLGSLGDINFVIEKECIKEAILVVAGDNLFEFSLKKVIEIYKKYNKSVVALYDVQDKELAKQYGIVAVDKENKIIEFEEKPSQPKSTLASTGIYVYPAYIFSMLQEFVKKYKNSDKAGNFLQWLYKKEHIYCYMTKRKWFDIGDLGQLEKARREFKN